MPISGEVVPFYPPISNVRVLFLFFFFPHPHQHLVVSLLNFSHLSGCLVLSRVVLICISVMTNDGEHCFMCLLAIHIYSFVKCLFKSFAH